MTNLEAGLLDTSTFILASRLDSSGLPGQTMISAITLAELSVGPLVAVTDAERAVRLAHVQQAEADFDPIPFDAHAARALGRVVADLRKAGKKSSSRALDAMIAAIALANRLSLYTCNPQDFAGIDGLDVVAVPHPDRGPITTLLDAVPGAFERAERGLADIDSGRVVPLDGLRTGCKGPRIATSGTNRPPGPSGRR